MKTIKYEVQWAGRIKKKLMSLLEIEPRIIQSLE